MAKARAPCPGPGSAPAAKPPGKKSEKRRFWDSGAPPGRAPGPGAGRPPTAPEDFSRNWKALRELLRPKPQGPGQPPAGAQVPPGRRPGGPPSRRSAARAAETGTTEPAARGGPAPPSRAGGAKRGAGGLLPAEPGQAKRGRRKAEKAPAAPAPALALEDAIWFDDVAPEDIEAAIGPEAAQVVRKQLGRDQGRDRGRSGVTLEKEGAFGGLTKALALDCEMVGVGPQGEESVAARVSLVNQFGKCVYDKYVRPAQPVTDYRTAVSGIRPEHLGQGEELDVVRKEVAALLRGRILVGHALHNDLKVLLLDHPRKRLRDTQKYKPFKTQVKSGRPSLKLLAKEILGLQVQEAEHCSIQDAQAAMRLYVSVRKEWESAARDRRPAAAAPRTGRKDT